MSEKVQDFTCLVGLKQVRRAISAGRAVKVLFARDADPALIDPLLAQCEENKIPAEPVRSMRELGRQCGIETGAATAAYVRKT